MAIGSLLFSPSLNAGVLVVGRRITSDDSRILLVSSKIFLIELTLTYYVVTGGA
jgi:hypothetical protein